MGAARTPVSDVSDPAQARLGGKMAGEGRELSTRSVFLPLLPPFPVATLLFSAVFGLCTEPLLSTWCRGTFAYHIRLARNV